MSERESILGHWHRLEGDPCAAAYPEHLEFRDGGVYLASSSETTFSFWQSGDYEWVDDGCLKIQTANDAMVPYDVSEADDVLTFRDSQGCEFRYRRADT